MRVRTFTGPIFRTRLGFHYTWYLAFVLIIAVVVTRFPEYYSFTERLLLGLGASLLFFLGMTIRQIAINVTSYYRRIPLKEVVLYPFGGVPLVAKEESLPILELLLAVVGLLSSLLIVVIFYLVYIALVVTGSVMVAWLIQWLAYINMMLFLVHFVPGFPLDGGRILRAILWKITRSYDRATRITIRIGQGAGVVFFLGGIALLINRQWFVGLFLVFLGWILYIAAARGSRNISVTGSLNGIMVQQIMSREFSLITRQLTLSQLAKDYILATGHCRFVVFDEDKLHGILTTDEMKSVPRKNWEKTTAGQIMIPSSQQTTAYVGQSASDLLARMNVYRISCIPVLDGNRVVGIADRDVMVRFNKTRTALKI